MLSIWPSKRFHPDSFFNMRSLLGGRQHSGKEELLSTRRMRRRRRWHTISGVGIAPRTLAATATSRDTGRRTGWRGLPGRIEGARGLPMRGRLLLRWPRSMHRILHTIPLQLWINGLLIAEPHTIWPPSRVTLSPTILTRPQSLWPTSALWRPLVGEMWCCSYPLETLHSKMCSIFHDLDSARFSLFAWSTSQGVRLYSTSQVQDCLMEISRVLIMSCRFWMVLMSQQLRHWLATDMCFTPRRIRLSMLLLPQPPCPSDHIPSSIHRGNLLILSSNGIYAVGILDSKESNSWPRTQPLVFK